MRVGLVIPLACGVLLAGCSFSTGGGSLSKAQVEKKIADKLAAESGQRPKAVICPDDLKGEKGTTMRCQAEADDGSKIGLTVTVTAVKGSHVSFSFEVDAKGTPARS